MSAVTMQERMQCEAQTMREMKSYADELLATIKGLDGRDVSELIEDALHVNVVRNQEGGIVIAEVDITYGGPTVYIDALNRFVSASFGDIGVKRFYDEDDDVIGLLDYIETYY